MEVVTLVRWLKKDGEFVRVDEQLCEVESNKASIEVPAWATGVVRHVAREGDTISTAAELARIEPPSDLP